jgi:hypothetical protein
MAYVAPTPEENVTTTYSATEARNLEQHTKDMGLWLRTDETVLNTLESASAAGVPLGSVRFDIYWLA